MAQEAWGRWGTEDEAGAPNLIGPEQVRLAAGLVRTGQVVRLTQPISDRTPIPAHRPGVMHFMGRGGRDHAAVRQAGVSLRDGDVVLIRTGWLETQDMSAPVDFNREPGIDVEAALYLAESGVAVVGADNFAIEVLPFPTGTVFPVHQRLIRD